MAAFNNISLYIKRADLYCTKDYIINIFRITNIGIVKDVKFIKKTDSIGREYNGAIVIFERWFMNPKVTKMFDDLDSCMDMNGATKFIYDNNGRYWFINVYKPIIEESHEFATVDASLPDKDRIDELEKLVKSMAAQMHYNQLHRERAERQLMEFEENHSHHSLCNMQLRFLLEDKDMELELVKRDNEQALKEAHDEVTILKTRLACIAIDLVRKEEALSKQLYVPNVEEMCIEELM